MKYNIIIKEKPLSKEEMMSKVKEFQEAFTEAVVYCHLEDIKKKT